MSASRRWSSSRDSLRSFSLRLEVEAESDHRILVLNLVMLKHEISEILCKLLIEEFKLVILEYYLVNFYVLIMYLSFGDIVGFYCLTVDFFDDGTEESFMYASFWQMPVTKVLQFSGKKQMQESKVVIVADRD